MVDLDKFEKIKADYQQLSDEDKPQARMAIQSSIKILKYNRKLSKDKSLDRAISILESCLKNSANP